MFAGIVLLDFEKVLLGMRANLNDVLRLDVLLNLFPISTVLLQSLEKRLMLIRRPVFPVLGNDIWFSRFLCRKRVRREWTG